ncbi:hypothetical protein [Streptomyces albipurpureus]|uniref:Uncharacterized protein n=1 Tax=Streptomyces albipurpureus TaxID=2897419 RepID=A0ABT0UQ06_9ACTN|nr:hypothetical protein [Streptomyces sp. CWNU-1]MCM2390687.1 hypothetical protein [Streptomyces sp. CWNU-1]
MADTRQQDRDQDQDQDRDQEQEQHPDQPVPRDLPDQQVQEGGDYLDVPPPPSSDESADEPDESADDPGDQRLPEADEAGAGRGEPRSGSVHPEQPVPDEPTG